jgi:transcriptional regulator GlxA family with amidase domain
MHRPDAVESIAVLAYEGFDELDVVGPLEVFRMAADMETDLTAEVVSLEPSRQVTGSHHLTIEPDGALGVAPDLLVVPGGGWSEDAERGVPGEIEYGALPDAIAECHAAGSTVASVCTGAMLLAAAELLEGRPATTHRSAREALAETGATVREARVVDDGDVLTAGGVTAGLDLALHIVGAVVGDAVAEATATAIEYERQGTVEVTDA